MSPPTRSRRLALAAAVSLGAFAIAEVAFRVHLGHFAPLSQQRRWARARDVAPERALYVPHPYLAYALNPAHPSHNALGFRGAEIERRKAPGAYRIACLGGSSTYDTEIADDELTFCAQLQRVLREEYGRERIEVVNAGVAEYTSWESLVNLQFRVLDLEPDLVVVYHATNDVMARLVPPATFRRDNTGYRSAWREEWHWWDHSLLLHALGVEWGFSQRNPLGYHVIAPHEKGDDAARLAANGTQHFRANLEALVAMARLGGAEVLIASWAHSPRFADFASREPYRSAFAEHNAVAREVAESTGAALFDFAALMPEDPRYWNDGRHSNPEGARLKAELFARHIDASFLSR